MKINFVYIFDKMCDTDSYTCGKNILCKCAKNPKTYILMPQDNQN